jgi:hypothetical protein
MNKIKIIFAVYLEKLHRYVFDNIYVQNKKTTKKDWILLKIYDLFYSIHPNFRKTVYNFNSKKYRRYKK